MLFAKKPYLCGTKHKDIKVMKKVIILSVDDYNQRLVGHQSGLLSLVSGTIVSELHAYVRLSFDAVDDFSIFSAILYNLGILHRCVIL